MSGEAISSLNLDVQYALRAGGLPGRAHIRRWVRAVGEGPGEITVRFVDEEEGQALNKTWRGKDYATNVLSFPYETEPVLLGDLVLCWPVVVREADEQGKSLEAHCAHLIVHGVLHLCGHDHEDDVEAQEMEQLEVCILGHLGYADPYAGEHVSMRE